MANTTRQGNLAGVGFLYRATGEGFTVGRPFGGDVRYDAMLDGGGKVHRVQVKSTVRLCRKDVYEVRIGRQVCWARRRCRIRKWILIFWRGW